MTRTEPREAFAAEASREYEAIFLSSPVAMAVMDEDGRFARANPALCAFLGRDHVDLLGRSPADLTLPDDHEVHAAVERRLRQDSVVGRVHKRYVRPDGAVVHGLVSAVAIEALGGRRRTLAQIEDVTDRMRLEEELVRLATHDPLTGLPGRRLLLERLEQALGPGATGTAGAVAVVFVDLDAFKLVNDALGHAAGDTVLRTAAERFAACMRPQDTVGRLAGDEFLVVAPGVDDEAVGRALAERLEAALRAPVPYDGDEIFVSCSLGLALRSAADERAPADLVAELLADADAAMYQAKRGGKRRYEVFDAAMRSRASERARVAADLRAAVAEERLHVHYQPVVHVQGQRPVGVEAVVRVLDGEGRMLEASQFLDVAEQIGLLPELDGHVLRVATEQVQRWRSEHGLDLHLSVNVSAGQVLRSLPQQVDEALLRSGLPAERLTVELTERVFIDGVQSAATPLHELSAQGVKLAIDDFGTGWASFTWLRQFPVSAIKIDKSFVGGLPASGPDRTLVRALSQLAEQLDMATVVEGVETEEQLASVADLLPPARSYAQGYLFGRPLPAADVLPLLLASARSDRATSAPAG